MIPLSERVSILEGGLASLRERDDRKRAEPDAGGLAVDPQALALGPRMASELHRLDQQRESEAGATVAVASGPRHGLDEGRGEPFRGSWSQWGVESHIIPAVGRGFFSHYSAGRMHGNRC